jgi:hypothetical protein
MARKGRLAAAIESTERALERELPPSLAADEVTDAIQLALPITASQLSACIERQRNALVRLIVDPHAPPIDGGIGKIAANIDALQRVTPTKQDNTQ